MKRLFVVFVFVFVFVLTVLWGQETIALRPSQELSYMSESLQLADGGIVTVWLSSIAGDRDIYAQRFGANGVPVWSESCSVVIKPGFQSLEDLILTSDGNYLVTWYEGNSVWGQLIDPQGQLLWAEQGVMIYDQYVLIAPNQSGGFYLIYTLDSGIHHYLKCRSIDSSLNSLWIPVERNLAISDQPFSRWSAVPVSDGGFIVNYAQADSSEVEHSYLKRFSASGLQVGEDTLLAPDAFPQSVFAINELSPDHYILWHVGEDNPCILTLQKMDAQGNLLLPQPLVLALPSSAGTTSTLYNHVDLTPLSDGGLLICWSYDAGTISYQKRIQRLSPDWQPLWNSEGVTVTQDSHTNYFRVQEDDAQHFFCTWTTVSFSDIWQIKAQRISPSGNLLWGTDGVLLDEDKPFVSSPLGFCGQGQYHCLWLAHEDNYEQLKRQSLNTSGEAQLNEGGVPFVSQLGGYSSQPLSIALAGSFFTFWQDYRIENSGIFFQKCDTELNTELADYGKRIVAVSPSFTQLLCQVEKLADDRIAVMYRYYGTQNYSYYLQIVDAMGEVLVPEFGYFLGHNLINPVIDCSDGDVYVAWMTASSGTNQTMLKAQRYVSGQPVWEAGGKVIALAPSNITEIKVKNRFLTWTQNVNGSIKSCVLRLDANGSNAPGWGAGALPLIANSTGSYYCHAMGMDGSDLIAFIEMATPSGFELYAQKVSPVGARLWGESGILLSTSPTSFHIGGAVYGNGASISYKATMQAALIHLQKLDSDGNKLFGADGALITQIGIMLDKPYIYLHQNGWYSVIFCVNLNTGMDYDIFHCAVSPDGITSPGGIQILSDGRLNQQLPSLTGVGNTAFISWEDKRSALTNSHFPGTSIYGAVIHSVGSPVDDPSVPALDVLSLNCYPNPFREGATIRFETRDDAATYLDVYNIKGQKVRCLISECKAAGAYTISFNGKDDSGATLANGLYFLRLKTGNSTKTAKAILLK